MGGSPKPPAPTPTEIALQQEQINQLRLENERNARIDRENDLLRPILLGELGFKADVDPNTGEILGFSEREQSEDEIALAEIERLSSERALAALKGELPTDPALLRDLEQRETTLNEQLRRDFGSLSAARSSTPGIERIREFDEFEAQTLDQARRGDLTLATNLALQTRASNTNQNLAAQGVISGTGGQVGAPGAISFQDVLGNLKNERLDTFKLEEEQRQNSRNTKIGAVTSGATIGGTIGSAFSPIGTAVGAGVGAGFGAIASRNA
jgi:hypothetical protein